MSLHPSSMSDNGALPLTPEQEATRFIETQLSHILDELAKPDGKPYIMLKRRRFKHSGYSIDQDSFALGGNGTVQEVYHTYSWPGNDVQDSWRFAVILRIMGQIAEGIKENHTITKRDIYYLDPVHFGTQAVVDRYLDDIAFTIGVDRAALHVQAAAKGLTAGRYRVILDNGSIVNVGGFPEGLLVPRVESLRHIDISAIRWILIIEKEAVFHRLVVSKYHELSAAGKGILITGKGYPDLATRQFVRYLSAIKALSSSPRVMMLVDADPDGMAILSTYKYGSQAHAHENKAINIAGLEWLGLSSNEIVSNVDIMASVDRNKKISAGRSSMECSEVQGLIPLRPRDRKKAISMLSNSAVFAEDGAEPTWRRELQNMLMLNCKAEIEVLYAYEGGIEEWLDKKLKRTLLDARRWE